MGSQLLVATSYGVLHRVSWEGKFDGTLLINLNLVPFANDLLPETRGLLYAQLLIVLFHGNHTFNDSVSPRVYYHIAGDFWGQYFCLSSHS